MLNDYVVYMRNTAKRWFKFHNVGRSPHERLYYTIASDGTHVFVLGGFSNAQEDYFSLIHVFDTSMCARLVNYLDSVLS
jgi:hypothetical protein